MVRGAPEQMAGTWNRGIPWLGSCFSSSAWVGMFPFWKTKQNGAHLRRRVRLAAHGPSGKGWGSDAVVALTGLPARLTLVRRGGSGRGARRGRVWVARGGSAGSTLWLVWGGLIGPVQAMIETGTLSAIWGGGRGGVVSKKGPRLFGAPRLLWCFAAREWTLVTRPRKTG